MKIGVLWKSFKENERRYPLHWSHLVGLSNYEMSCLYFENNYPGLENLVGKFDINLLSRSEIFNVCDIIIIPKPDYSDLKMINENTTIFGWPHTVQGFEITQVAIEKKLTIIAWENMHRINNGKKEHVFARNNELAGFAAVAHFMEINGLMPGSYGHDLKIAVLGFGSTGRGAINALIGLGATDITVFSKRNKHELTDAIKNIKYKTYSIIDNQILIENIDSNVELQNYDLIVNCVLQNPNKPLVFIREKQIEPRINKLLIIDISCDKGMSFDFARPTSFESPIISTNKYIYYSVDHTPTYYWNTASYEISGALIPYLKYIINNNGYRGNAVLERAVDIEQGTIMNLDIIEYQNRDNFFPYKKKNNS